jgi:hypothetical protein
MDKRTTLILIAILTCLLMLVGGAQAMSSPNYGINWSVIGGGGGTASSEHYGVMATAGQASVSMTDGTAHGVGAGYWYGAVREYQIFLPLVMRE